MHKWMIYLREHSDIDLSHAELGLREQDNIDWTATLGNYQNHHEIAQFVSTSSVQGLPIQVDTEMQNVRLSEQQERALNFFCEAIDFVQTGVQRETLKRSIIIQGKAGSGKSTLIQAAKVLLNNSLGSDSYALLAQTGSAAALIGGQTIHSKLIIGINRNLNSLSDRQLTELQENLRGCQFIIIDEMSLVGCSWLKKIDIRCREAKGVDLPFGNMFLVLLGDIKQLPPILDRAFYGTGFNSEYSIAGQQPYRNIECSVILPTSFLQNDEQAEFRQLLDRLADGRTTIADWNSLSTRCLDQINAGDFANSLRLFDTVDKVQEYNQQKLRKFDSVYRCLATNSSSLAARTPSRDADNLENVLYLAFNCRVMLRRNLWAVAGLVNGSLGTVTDIVVSPDHEMPVFVMVRFDHYLGPTLDGSVPIQPVQGSWISNEQQCTRIQLPLSVARVRTFFFKFGFN